MNKETVGIARQFVLGVVQSADGPPLMHTVHAGNVAETKTLKGMLETVLKRFAVERVIIVADRGLLSLDNIAELTRIADDSARNCSSSSPCLRDATPNWAKRWKDCPSATAWQRGVLRSIDWWSRTTRCAPPSRRRSDANASARSKDSVTSSSPSSTHRMRA